MNEFTLENPASLHFAPRWNHMEASTIIASREWKTPSTLRDLLLPTPPVFNEFLHPYAASAEVVASMLTFLSTVDFPGVWWLYKLFHGPRGPDHWATELARV